MPKYSDEPDPDDRLTAEEPGGFTQVPDSLLLNPDVSDGAYRMYALLKHHSRKRNAVFPGRRRLAGMLGLKSVRSVDARLNELQAVHYLEVTPRYHASGGRTSNQYHLFFYPRPPSGPTPVDDPAPQAPEPEDLGDMPGASDDAGQTPEGAAGQAPGDQEQISAPGARGGADICAGPEQELAGQGSTPIPSTSLPSTAPSSTTSAAGDPETANDRGGEEISIEWARALVEALPEAMFPRTRAQYDQVLTLAAPLATELGFPNPVTTARELAALRPLPEHVSHPVGLLRARIGELPPPRRRPASRPRWCGTCDEVTRLRETGRGEEVVRCSECHPERPASAVDLEGRAS